MHPSLTRTWKLSFGISQCNVNYKHKKMAPTPKYINFYIIIICRTTRCIASKDDKFWNGYSLLDAQIIDGGPIEVNARQIIANLYYLNVFFLIQD